MGDDCGDYYVKSSLLTKDQTYVLASDEPNEVGDNRDQQAIRFRVDIEHLFGVCKDEVGFFYFEDIVLDGYTQKGIKVPTQFVVIRKRGLSVMHGPGSSIVPTTSSPLKLYSSGVPYTGPFTMTDFSLLNVMRFSASDTWHAFREFEKYFDLRFLESDFSYGGTRYTNKNGEICMLVGGRVPQAPNVTNQDSKYRDFVQSMKVFLMSAKANTIGALDVASEKAYYELRKKSSAEFMALEPTGVSTTFPPELRYRVKNDEFVVIMLTKELLMSAYELYGTMFSMSRTLQVPNRPDHDRNDTYVAVVCPGRYKLATITMHHTIRVLHFSDTIQGMISGFTQDMKTQDAAADDYQHTVPVSVLIKRYVFDFPTAEESTEITTTQWAARSAVIL